MLVGDMADDCRRMDRRLSLHSPTIVSDITYGFENGIGGTIFTLLFCFAPKKGTKEKELIFGLLAEKLPGRDPCDLDQYLVKKIKTRRFSFKEKGQML